MSVGGGASESDSRQRIDPTQMRYLESLWGAGQNLQQGSVTGPYGFMNRAQELSDQIMPTIQGAQNVFQNIAAGESPGQAFLQQTLGANPQLQNQIDFLGEDIGRNLSENVLPHLRMGGVAVGAPGGSRTQIAEGMAAENAMRDFARGASTMRFNDLMRQTSSAQALTQGQLAGAAGSMQGSGDLFNLGMAPLQAAWQPLQFQAGLLGGPTVIGDSDSSSWDMSFAF